MFGFSLLYCLHPHCGRKVACAVVCARRMGDKISLLVNKNWLITLFYFRQPPPVAARHPPPFLIFASGRITQSKNKTSKSEGNKESKFIKPNRAHNPASIFEEILIFSATKSTKKNVERSDISVL